MALNKLFKTKCEREPTYLYDPMAIQYTKREHERSTLGWVIIIIFVVLTAAVVISTLAVLTLRSDKLVFTSEPNIIVLNEYTKDPTPKEVLRYLQEINVKFPEVVLAQAINETGFKSDIFKNNKNLFNLKRATTRPTTAAGIEGDFCVYRNWKASVLDYALYQAAYYRNVQTQDQYFQALDQMRFAEDPEYINKIKKTLANLDTWIK